MSNHPEHVGSTSDEVHNIVRRGIISTDNNDTTDDVCRFLNLMPPAQRRVNSDERHNTQEPTSTTENENTELNNVDKDPYESEPVPAGPSWAKPSEVDSLDSAIIYRGPYSGRHQLIGNVIEANELVMRRRRANNEGEGAQGTSSPKYSPYEYNRNNSPGDRLLQRSLNAHTPHRVIELVTQASTITYPTPTYTAKPWPTPTYPTPPSPTLAYPQPFLQNPAASQLVQAWCNTFFPHHTMFNFQPSMFIPSMPPNLVPLIRHENDRPLNNYQQSTTLLPNTDKPLDLSVPTRPLPTLIPITSSISPITKVYSGSGGTQTPNRGSPHTHAVTSISSNVVGGAPIQSSDPFHVPFYNENQMTTNQNVANTDCSLHLSNQTTRQPQPYHQGQWSQSRAPDLLEHQQYQLWPLGHEIEIQYSVEVETTDYDDWLNMRSPDPTVVRDASKTPAPIPTSTDTIVPVPPLTSATPSLTTLPPEKQKPDHK